MSNSKESLIAQKIMQLMDNNELSNSFNVFNEIYEVISNWDLNGVEIYIGFENLSSKKSFDKYSISNLLDKMFLRYSTYDIDKLCQKIGMTRYDCWNRFSSVVYCLEPILFHYVNEKEFFGLWHSAEMEWER